MVHIVDVRGTGGELVVLGGALTLPTSDYSVATPLNGSLRYNTTSHVLEIYAAGAWSQVTGTGGSGAVSSFNTRTGNVTLATSDVTAVLHASDVLGILGTIPYANLPASLATFPLIYSQGGLQPFNHTNIMYIPVTIAFTLTVNCAGSSAVAGVSATSTTTFAVSYIRSGIKTAIGTVTFSPAANTGVFATSAYTAQIGDIFVLTSDSAQDPTLADVGIVILATRTA